MDEYGAVKYTPTKELQILRGRRKPGLDMHGNKIFKGDALKIVDGHNKNYKGRIVFVEGNIVFLHNKEFGNTLGIFVDRCRNSLILGSSLISGKNDARYRAGRYPTNNQNKKDIVAGKYLTICKGEYKGHRGRALSEIGDKIRVELQTQCRTVTIPREDVIADSSPEDEEDEMMGTGMPDDMGSSQSAFRAGSQNQDTWGDSTGTAKTPPHTSESPGWEGGAGGGSPEGNQSPGWEKDNLWKPATPGAVEAGGNSPGDAW